MLSQASVCLVLLASAMKTVLGVDYYQNFADARLRHTPACPDPEPVANSYRWSVAGGVQYACVDGYVLTGGSLTILCNPSGSWTGSPPICEIDCGRPPVTPGTLFVNVTKQGMVTRANGQALATYTCDPRLNETDNPSSVPCQDDKGFWFRPHVLCIYPTNIIVNIKGTDPSSATTEDMLSTATTLSYSSQSTGAETDSTTDVQLSSTVPTSTDATGTPLSDLITPESQSASTTQDNDESTTGASSNPMVTNFFSGGNTSDLSIFSYLDLTADSSVINGAFQRDATTSSFSDDTTESQTPTVTGTTDSVTSTSGTGPSSHAGRVSELDSACQRMDIPQGSDEFTFPVSDGSQLVEVVSLEMLLETVDVWTECVRAVTRHGQEVYGLTYEGSVNTTESGIPCQPWADINPHAHDYNNLTMTTFPDASFNDVSNLCRNPARDGLYKEKPWCFTTDTSVRWEYCDVPECPFYSVQVSLVIASDSSLHPYSCAQTLFYGIKTSFPVKIDCPQQPTAPFGTHVSLKVTSYHAARPLYLCNIEVVAVDYESGCGEPPHQRGWKLVSLTGYALNDEAVYTCAAGFHHMEGSGLSVCLETREWSDLTLRCSDEYNHAVDPNGGATRDSDLITCSSTAFLANAGSVTENVTLAYMVEVHEVTVTVNQPDTLSPGDITLHAKIWDGTDRQCHDVTSTPFGLLYSCPVYPITNQLRVVVAQGAPFNLCEIKVFGRKDPEDVECRQRSSGTDYKGRLNVTRGGKPCIAWTQAANVSDYEFPDGDAIHVQNFCRNPILKSTGQPFTDFRPICFYSDYNGHWGWGFCDILKCQVACRMTEAGMEYEGHIDYVDFEKTSSSSCARWATGMSLFRRNSDFVGDAPSESEDCKNPGRSQERPWCYTNTNREEYKYCNIPYCPRVTTTSYLFLDLRNLTDVDELRIVVTSFRECHATKFSWRRYTSSIFDGIVNNLCGDSPGQQAEVLCVDRSGNSTAFGDDADWMRLLLVCPLFPISVAADTTHASMYDLTTDTQTNGADALTTESEATTTDRPTTTEVQYSTSDVETTTDVHSHDLTTADTQDSSTSDTVTEALSTSAPSQDTTTFSVTDTTNEGQDSSSISDSIMTPAYSTTGIMLLNSTQLPKVCAASCSVVCPNDTNVPSTYEELQKEVEAIKRRLLVDKSSLSKTVRAKTSAEDERPSSQVSGALAIVFLVLVVLFLMSGDIVTVAIFTYRLFKGGTGDSTSFS